MRFLVPLFGSFHTSDKSRKYSIAFLNFVALGVYVNALLAWPEIGALDLGNFASSTRDGSALPLRTQSSYPKILGHHACHCVRFQANLTLESRIEKMRFRI